MPHRCPVFSSRPPRDRRPADQDYDQRRRADPALAEARRLRCCGAWQKCRGMILAANPLCFDPFGTHARLNELVPAAEVHHIQPLAKRPDLAYEESNLAPVCKPCHAQLDAAERQGVPPLEKGGQGGVP